MTFLSARIDIILPLLLRTIFMMALFIALWNIHASDSCLKVFLYLINNSSTLQDKKVLSLIERTYICETSSFGRKVSRRKAVLLLGFSCSVAFYNKTMGFFNRLILYQINYEGFRYLVNDFKGLPTFFQWFMALSSWKNGFVFVLHTLQGIKFR